VALSTADGIFGVRDENAQINLMRLAIEEAIFSDMHFDRKALENSSSEQTTNLMKRVFATGAMYALLRVCCNITVKWSQTYLSHLLDTPRSKHLWSSPKYDLREFESVLIKVVSRRQV
jgi:hypothetical protein